MLFNILLYLSLAIFIAGLIYRVAIWLSRSVGLVPDHITTGSRAVAAVKGILGTIFSTKLLVLIKALVLDVLLQRRTLKVDGFRWAMHMLIFYGFMVLLLMHALENYISEPYFTDYYSTLNPYMFIRDLAGLMVIVGVALAVYRRFFMKVPRLMTSGMDVYAIIIVAAIIVSGIFLEGAKIISLTAFNEMVDEYAGMDDEEEIRALETYWVAEYGVVSPNVNPPFDPEVLEQGMELTENNCMECHSRPQWAFTGYACAKLFSPLALALDQIGAKDILWYIHFIACFLGLAYLPFSKMFHLISTPVSLLANAVMNDETSDPANIATRQALELDACVHCGTCTSQCRAGIAFVQCENLNILPSEKMLSLKELAAGKNLSESELRFIQEGLYLCTNCHRCTDVCPAGINLQSLWFSVRERLLQEGVPELLMLTGLSYYRGLRREDIAKDQYSAPLGSAKGFLDQKYPTVEKSDVQVPPSASGVLAKRTLAASNQGDTFASCFACSTCSTVCPVANNYENDLTVLGMVPHQIVHAAILGLADPIFRSGMLWGCVGCYECQQNCPQGVHVTDVLYELKNLAMSQNKKHV